MRALHFLDLSSVGTHEQRRRAHLTLIQTR
jgi:hypothetical protein